MTNNTDEKSNNDQEDTAIILCQYCGKNPITQPFLYETANGVSLNCLICDECAKINQIALAISLLEEKIRSIQNDESED